MPNFFCGSLVVVRCGPQGLSVLFDRPGDRTAAVAAGYSYLLVSKGSAKIIRMSLSREQPPAHVERAQQEQDYAASRSGHAGCRLFLFRCKRECGLFSPRSAANDTSRRLRSVLFATQQHLEIPATGGGARASVSAKSVAIFRSGTRFATFGLVVPGKIVTFESYLFKPIERCSNVCSRLRPSSIKRG